MLAALGISGFDEQVYRAFLRQTDQTVRTVATTVDATPSRVRHAVGRLEALGLLRRAGHGHYRPIGPETALGTLLNRHRAETDTAFAALQATVDELAYEHRAGRLRTDASALVEVISGREAVDRRVEEISRAITSHMWVLDKPPYLTWPDGVPETNETELAVTLAMIERGVEVRSVYCPESMEKPGRFEVITKLATLGEQSRILPSLPFKLRIVDRRVALVPLVGGVYDHIAVVHASGLLDALLELFEAYWDRAKPIVATDGADPDQPGSDDLLVLRMLQAGFKDHAIARQLGVSTRTATRRIAAIAAMLGATSRFQAGVEAAKRGWI